MSEHHADSYPPYQTADYGPYDNFIIRCWYCDAAISPLWLSPYCGERCKNHAEAEQRLKDIAFPPSARVAVPPPPPLGGFGKFVLDLPATEERITDPKTGGQKGQKEERFDLLPFDALEEVARVYGCGARKYEDDNWLKGYRWRLSAGAMLRHISKFMLGEHRVPAAPPGMPPDPTTGCHHLACAAWHCLTLITFDLRELGTDDRAPPKRTP